MKNDRTRAGRKAARRYTVSPVARAVRGVLSLSAVALMFSGTGAALAKSPAAGAPAPIEHVPTERARLSHEFASVMDLTRVGDEWTPKSVVEEGFDAFASGFGGGDTMFAASEGDTGYMAAVDDLTTLLPGTYHAGPGGVSGPSNVVGRTFALDSYATFDFTGGRTDQSINGFATSVFVTSANDIVLGAAATYVSTTGQTWSAAWEIEGQADTTINHGGTAEATVTGDDGVAFAIYVNGGESATINNSGTLTATGTGARSYATGMLAMSVDGDAAVHNTGTVTATSYVAIGAHAYSIYGDATATNAAGDTITAKGTAGSVGLWAYSYYGTATVDNAGTIDSSANIARGAWADGAYAVGINSGTIGAYGDAEAIGLQARGFYSADASNTGTIIASATGYAFGLHSQAMGDASATNGIGATVNATAVDGGAYGALVVGQLYSANATNFGTLDADGGEFAAGIAAIAGTTANVLNEGTIDATANGPEGFAVGVIAIGGDVLVDNDGRIDATGFFATGVDVRAGGNVSIDNAYNIDVEGFDATGISASTTGENVHVGIVNSGGVYASSDTAAYGGFATGIAGVARGYLGSVSIGNGGQVIAEAKYGDAQGVVASADMDAIVGNAGTIAALGGTSAYGVLALSADGDVTVDNDGGIIAIATDAREGTAYAVAMQTNTGKATVTNDGAMYAIGVAQATGVYASALWDDATITNNAMLGAAGKYGNATGAIAISYTGNATVFNTYDATAQIQAMGDAGGLRAISLYGNANVVNYGEVVVQAGGRARGLTARSLYGDAAIIVNLGNVEVTGGSSAWGAWALADYYGATYVENTGAASITAIATTGDAIGVRAGAAYGANVTNDGLIDASGYGSGIGVLAISYYGDATVVNRAGTINAHGGSGAMGIYGIASGVVDLTNAGTIDASVDGGVAFGMLGYGAVAKVNNDGDVVATAGSGAAFGLYGFGTTTSYVTNNVGGTVYAHANDGDAIGTFSAGLHAYSTNLGDIEAIGSDSATGMETHGIDGGSGETVVAMAYNGGAIYASATDTKYGEAIGIFATSDGDAIVNNRVGATIEAHGRDAYGIVAASGGLAMIDNHGDIVAVSTHPDGTAIGISAYGYDTAGVGNDGSIYADGKYAVGISAVSYSRGASANNGAGGDIGAVSYFGSALGMLAQSELDDALVINSGTIGVESVHGGAMGVVTVAGATATGRTEIGSRIQSQSTYGVAGGMYLGGDIATAYSAGEIEVSGGISAVGIAFDATSGATLVNDGTITVVQTGAVPEQGAGLVIEDGNAIGIAGNIDSGMAIVGNNGTIDVSAYGIATGTAVSSTTGGSIAVVGDGTLIVEAQQGDATGINAFSLADGKTTEVSVTTDGNTHVVAGVAAARGVRAIGSVVTVDNSGTMDVLGNGFAIGLDVAGAETASISNTGTLTVGVSAPAGGNAVGINGYGANSLSIANGGDIDVDSSERAAGIAAYAYGLLSLSNAGNIDATSTGIVAVGAQLISNGGIVVDNQGDITAHAAEFASGIGGHASGGDVTIANGGAIAATAANVAYGVQMFSDGDGFVAITNTGSIDAEANRAMGVRVDGYGAVGLYGDGDVTAHGGELAIGIALFGDQVDIQAGGTVVGAAVDAGYGVVAVGDTTVAFHNDGQIDGSASADDGLAVGAILDGATITADNAGNMGATALGSLGNATAFLAHGGDIDFTNAGTLTAHAGDQAIGAQLIAEGNALFANTGDITATADHDAIGIQVRGDSASFTNDGHATATATGLEGSAYGVEVVGLDTTFANHHEIGALAEGENGFAIGVLVAGDVTLDVDNAGAIDAMATGLYGQAIALAAYGDGDVTVANSGTAYAVATQGAAIGAAVSGYGDVAIDNSGTISAHAAGQTIGLRVDGDHAASVANSGTIAAMHEDTAVALSLHAAGGTIVDNSGFITALASDAGSIAIEGSDAIEDIRNSGTITGTFDLGGGDDLFTNADGGAWLLRGNACDFGDGDDAIVNAGTIVLENATIGLGANGAAGNSFTNTGTLVIEGDSHVDMGTGALVAAFENNGTISFIDGAPDDMLTIAGDFAGEGAINVDVSLLNATSDMLYIDGNIVSSSVQTLNVALLDMIDDTDGIDIPVVAVRGESAAGNVVPGSFNLGTVKWSPSNFIDLDLSINRASNGDVDLFSLNVVAGGVNDTGSLAASIASGAHSLMGAQVGTFRQRMGVFSQLGDSDKGAWVRVFGDKGTIDPDVRLDNLPQGGAFKFDQTNSGIEAGVNALVTDGWYVGASVGGSKGKQDLVDGFGRDDIDGMTLGGYLTWVGAQGYADISYRWMDFDAEMTSAAGVQEVGGNAGAFNVEAGWNAWTSAGGMQLVPQVQYTRTTVDVDTVHGEFTDFVADGGTSSRARVGLELQQTFKSGDTTWTPYGVLSAVREMQGEQRFAIGDVFTGRTSTKGTSAQVEFGVNARIGRTDIWGGLNWTDGGALDAFIGGQIGVRYTW